MNKRQEANLRVKVHITAALLKLLDEKSISDITISEIIAEAGVARASFYRNYASKESVITTLITDILEQFRRDVQYDGENYYTYENIHRSFEYFSRYGKQILDLHRFGYGSLILEKLNQLHEEIAGTMPHRSIERYRLYIYIGSLYNTGLVWLQNGKPESVDEISEVFYRVCGFSNMESSR